MSAGWIVVGVALACIAAATLPPGGRLGGTVGFGRCLFCGEYGGQDFVLNVALFLPLGLGLGLVGWGAGRAALAALVVSTAIELLQLTVIPGRSAVLGDLVANTAGGGLGALLTLHRGTLLHPGAVAARRLAAGSALLWLGFLALGMWGVGISLPRTVYWTQWQPDLGQFDRYDGRVLDGRLGETPLPPAFGGGSAILRQRLVDGPIALSAIATPGHPTDRIAPILSVFDEHQVEVLVLGQLGRRLVFRVRSRAADLRLRVPAIALDDFFAPEPDTLGDTIRVRAEHRGTSLALTATHARGAPRSRVQPYSPLLVWSLFYPFDRPIGVAADVLSALTAVVLVLPLGYLLRRGASPAAAHALGALAVAVGLGGIPPLFGHPPAPWGQWVVALVAVALGGLIGGRVVRSR